MLKRHSLLQIWFWLQISALNDNLCLNLNYRSRGKKTDPSEISGNFILKNIYFYFIAFTVYFKFGFIGITMAENLVISIEFFFFACNLANPEY